MKTKNYTEDYFRERDILVPQIAQTLEVLMRQNKLNSVLDVGCGTGLLVKYLNDQGFEAFGCDNSKIAVKKALKINRKKIFQASAAKLPFKKNSFEIVSAISVVEHLTPNQVDKFLKEAKRVLAPNGFIFLITPNYSSILRLIQKENWFAYKDPTHINFYTPQRMKALLSSHGFENIKFTFPCQYQPSFDWEFPSFYPRLPKVLKITLIYLLFSSPLFILRNSFWVKAQKND